MSNLEKTWDQYSGENALKTVAWEDIPLSNELQVDENLTVLDAGCGTGAYMRGFLEKTRQVYGLDISPEMLKAAQSHQLKVCRGDLCELPFNDASFDIVFSGVAINYVPNWPDALGEMARVLKPGGHCLIIGSNRWSLLPPLRIAMNAFGKYRYGTTYHTSLKDLRQCGRNHELSLSAQTIKNRIAPWQGSVREKFYSLLTHADKLANSLLPWWGCEAVVLLKKTTHLE